MAYITYQQYLDLYGTCPISEEEFPVYAGLASDMIDSVTRYGIVKGGGISALPSIFQTRPIFYSGKGFSIGRCIVQYNHKARRSDGQPFRAFLA